MARTDSDSPILKLESTSRVGIYSRINIRVIAFRGGATGWTGVDMSTPLYFRIDFLIRLTLMKKVGGGVNFSFIKVATHSPRLQFNDQSLSFGFCISKPNGDLELFLLMMAKCNKSI